MANFDNGDMGPLAQASVKGTVKWFNATKGFGFITLDNGGDAFCHASALAALGTPNLPQGSTIICDLQESPRGLQVVTVHSVDTSTATESGFGGGSGGPARRPRREGGFGGGGFGGGGGDRGGLRLAAATPTMPARWKASACPRALPPCWLMPRRRPPGARCSTTAGR